MVRLASASSAQTGQLSGNKSQDEAYTNLENIFLNGLYYIGMINQKPQKIPFTEDGYRKLEKNKKDLLKERPEVVKRLQTAREMGDLSENGMYKAARFELGNIDRKLRELSHLLELGIVTESKDTGKVEFGCRVTLKSGAGEKTFTMVNEHESNPMEKKLSVKSPLGKKLIGKQVGEKVELTAPAGKTTYTITAVL